MKKTLLLFATTTILLIINAFQTPTTPVENIKTAYLTDMTAFEKSVKDLKNETEKHPLSSEGLKSAFKLARLNYKKIEWLISYLEPENDKNFNGAPLPSVETIHFTEIAPRGFQPLEALIFSENPSAEAEKLQQLVADLAFNTARWHQQITTENLSDRQVFEAFRIELIQLFTQSLTGFDSPVAFHSLPEALAAWSNLEKNMQFYEKNMSKIDPSVSVSFFDIFDKGKAYLVQNQDFDTFDRLTFYKKFLQPLFAHIVKTQRLLGIEFYKLTSGKARAWNDESTDIFDPQFLNAPFYSGVRQKNYEDSAEKIELGRLLFFDPIMSASGKKSCASCHRPENGYAEPLAKSLDLSGKPVERNAPSLAYAGLAGSQFWDGHAKTLEEQLMHVVSSTEMGNFVEELPERLRRSRDYVARFKRVFPQGDAAVQFTNIQKAVGAFVRSLAVFDSEFDQFMRGEVPKIDPSVQRGFNVFMGKAKCGTCHFAPVFNGTVPPQYLETEFEVLGIPNEKGQLDADLGKYRFVPAEKYRHAFKTVSVRNVALSAPFMHNGHYKNLEDVVDFYEKGGGVGLGFDLQNQTLPFDKLVLSRRDRRDLVHFMNSLTDKRLPKGPKALPQFEDAPTLSNRKIGGEY